MKRQKFEVKQYYDHVAGKVRKDIYIDEKLFEWEMDPNSLQKAREMGPAYYLMAQKDVQKHFMDSLSEFLGRKISQKDIIRAIQKGVI